MRSARRGQAPNTVEHARRPIDAWNQVICVLHRPGQPGLPAAQSRRRAFITNDADEFGDHRDHQVPIEYAKQRMSMRSDNTLLSA